METIERRLIGRCGQRPGDDREADHVDPGRKQGAVARSCKKGQRSGNKLLAKLRLKLVILRPSTS
jgi:hypothetical protein